MAKNLETIQRAVVQLDPARRIRFRKDRIIERKIRRLEEELQGYRIPEED